MRGSQARLCATHTSSEKGCSPLAVRSLTYAANACFVPPPVVLQIAMESPVDRMATELAVPIAYLLGSNNKSNGTGGDSGIFIDTFCRPDLSPEDFQNQLGAFTPCFIDIALLSEPLPSTAPPE